MTVSRHTDTNHPEDTVLSPELEQLHGLLASLKDHEHPAGLIVEDESGCRWSIRKAYAVGTRTDDPGLVIRLAAADQNAGLAATDCERCPRCGQEDVDGVRWVDMVGECVADVCPARDGRP